MKKHTKKANYPPARQNTINLLLTHHTICCIVSNMVGGALRYPLIWNDRIEGVPGDWTSLMKKV